MNLIDFGVNQDDTETAVVLPLGGQKEAVLANDSFFKDDDIWLIVVRGLQKAIGISEENAMHKQVYRLREDTFQRITQ
jgi:hypothetical protein